MNCVELPSPEHTEGQWNPVRVLLKTKDPWDLVITGLSGWLFGNGVLEGLCRGYMGVYWGSRDFNFGMMRAMLCEKHLHRPLFTNRKVFLEPFQV